jgi:hypothetical protein
MTTYRRVCGLCGRPFAILIAPGAEEPERDKLCAETEHRDSKAPRRPKADTGRSGEARADVCKQYVTMLERGTRKAPALPVLKRIAKALGVPVTELLEYAGETNGQESRCLYPAIGSVVPARTGGTVCPG